MTRTVLRAAGCAAALMLAAPGARADKASAPIPPATLAIMAAKGTSASAPALLRAYKKEGEIEVWKQARDGRYVLVKTFPICRWSGQLGPKRGQGDRQTPEGFYPVARRQLNPNSAYYLSFDTGFPNAYDRAHGYSGSALMVHGTCSSAGCFAMTDRQVGEIYAIVRDALNGGQAAFQFQSFPFRMTAQNIARYRLDPNINFWRQLKEGSDRFEATGEEPVVTVKDGRYAFAPSRDPAREILAKARLADEARRTTELVVNGAAAIRTTYSDGGQHPTFAALMRVGAYLGDVSRPEALPLAGQDVTLLPAKAPPRLCKAETCRVQLASLPVGVEGAARLGGFGLPGLEPSPFEAARVAARTTPVARALSGSARILPVQLAAARFEVVAAR